MAAYSGNWTRMPPVAGTALATACRNLRGVPCSTSPNIRKTSRYPFRLLTTVRTGLVNSWEISHPNVIRPASTGRMRLYSSHSPGRERGGTSVVWSSKSTSRSSAVMMAAPLGAEK